MSWAWRLTLVTLVAALASIVLLGYVVWAAIGGQAGWEIIQAEFSTDEEAVEHARRATELRGDDPAMHLWLGATLAGAGETEEAIGAYRQAARLDPQAVEPHLRMARLHLREEELAPAEEAIERALEIDSESASAHVLHGRLLAERDEPEAAAEAYRRALKLGGDQQEICYPLGRALEDAGDREGAIRAYRRGADSCDSRCRERLAELQHEREASAGGEAGTREDEEWTEEREWEDDEVETIGPGFGVAMVGFWLLYMIFIFGVMALTWGGWVVAGLAIYDCAQRAFDGPRTRALWCVLLFIVHWIGAIIYYFAIYRPDDPPHIGREQTA
ncbi:MAG: tetratricopeptide repeat protein [Armatimonadota bacterium]|nr:tetratricopeptide repeat protein [Armatimonadota bacterium]